MLELTLNKVNVGRGSYRIHNNAPFVLISPVHKTMAFLRFEAICWVLDVRENRSNHTIFYAEKKTPGVNAGIEKTRRTKKNKKLKQMINAEKT